MDNLQLRQRIVRSMIRVGERTNNMRKPEKFEYRKHMTAAFMDMLELCIEANRARGQRRVELQNKMDTKLDVLRSLVDTAVSPEDRLISPGLHEVWSKELNEIGRMLLHPDAKTLNRWRVQIEDYLNNVLHLELNGKTTIGLVKHGITFVGCRIFPGYRKPTKQSVKKMKARMRYIAKEYEAGLIDFDAVDATMQSYFGMLSHCSTHGLQRWIEKNIAFKRKEPAAEAKEVNIWT